MSSQIKKLSVLTKVKLENMKAAKKNERQN